MRQTNINMLHDTIKILEQGYYVLDGKKIYLKLSFDQMEKAIVYLPKDIDSINKSKEDFSSVHYREMHCSCENIDSYALANKIYKNSDQKENHILVLNLANPVNPGGGVRRGAKAQEEDLCRKSSLLISLEGEKARSYYEYNRSLHTFMGSDAVIISPDVEIIKDENGNLIDDSFVVSVMTCAAPMLTYGMESLSDKEYQKMMYHRITGMLKVAAYLGYKTLVLGAFGCGAFHNDAHIVSDLFYKALKEFQLNDKNAEEYFFQINFAVLDHSKEQYNFKEFSRNFNHFCHDKNNETNNG